MFKPPLTGEKLLRWECVVHTRVEAEANRQRNASQCPQCCTAFAEEREWPKTFRELVNRARGSSASVTLAADVFRAMIDSTCPDFGAPDPYTQQKLQMMTDNAHVAGEEIFREGSHQLRLRKILIENKRKGFHSTLWGGICGVPCYCRGWSAFKVHEELEAAFVEIAKCQHIYESENERMCKYVCSLFFDGVQPDPDDLPKILRALQRREELERPTRTTKW